jgi:acetyltransferase-like isoleucine patch superfamily enzyme
VNVLIGAGGHARDIYHTLRGHWQIVEHHSLFRKADEVVIGINDPRLRAEIAAELGIVDLPWLHPDALVPSSCAVAVGVHVNYGVKMTRTRVGRWSTISPGVIVCGDVTIGERVLVGAGAVVCERVSIGDGATVGAGAVVLPDVCIPAGETWVGTPARKVHP